jgi:hypothetical protein
MLSESERQKKLPEWLELDGHRHPGGLKRWRRRLTWGTLLLCAAVAAGAWFVPRSSKLVQAAPVSPAHANFNEDCARCHTAPLTTASRFAPWKSHVHAVPNDACAACHAGPDHNVFLRETQACAGCHREHRGQSLTRVADGFCLDCHKDLKAHHTEPAVCRFQDVRGFPAGHPETAMWRGSDERFPDRGDPSKLYFNHRKHLAEQGMPTPGGGTEKLDCGSCHVADAAGRYMQPVRYESHCARCHPLSVRLAGRFEGPELERLAREFNRTPAPHRSPPEVRAALRERLVRLVQAAPMRPGAEEPLGAPPRPPSSPPITEEQWQRVKGELKASEELLFVNRQQAHVERWQLGFSSGCAFCHVEKEKGRGSDGLPEYEPSGWRLARPPEESKRWLAHARFDHKSHQVVSCTECHAATDSEKTADLLMPKLETCARCHSAKAGVRNDCVCCHQYHPRGGPDGHPRRTIDAYLGK